MIAAILIVLIIVVIGMILWAMFGRQEKKSSSKGDNEWIYDGGDGDGD